MINNINNTLLIISSIIYFIPHSVMSVLLSNILIIIINIINNILLTIYSIIHLDLYAVMSVLLLSIILIIIINDNNNTLLIISLIISWIIPPIPHAVMSVQGNSTTKIVLPSNDSHDSRFIIDYITDQDLAGEDTDSPGLSRA